MQNMQGLAASPGIAQGQVWRFQSQPPQIDERALNAADLESAWQDFLRARQRVDAHLEALQAQVLQRQGAEEAAIFESHRELLLDEELESDIRRLMAEEGKSPTAAVKLYLDEVAATMRGLDDAYMRERAAEFEDLQHNLLLALNDLPFASLAEAPPGCIIVARDLSPSETAQLQPERVRGFVLELGGLTSHVAILARNLALPAVMGIPGILQWENGSDIIIDGGRGLVVHEPDAATRQHYQNLAEEQRQQEALFARLRDEPARSADGQRLKLYSNIGSPKDVPLLAELGSEGVGLFRSEFLFMEAKEAPSEVLQYGHYRQVLEALPGKTVILRLLDVGGDKPLPYLNFPREENPFLGWRGVRMYGGALELFHSQIRAALRAAMHGDLWLMVPMIINVDELRWVRDEIQAQIKKLQAEALPCVEKIRLGVMIETPAAALIAPQLAREADFFSIGTNDLCQYTLAVDRGNSHISHLYDGLHPAVLRLMKISCDAARAAGIEIGLCGEMGGSLEALPLLLGLGLDEISISGRQLPAVKHRLRQLNAAQCRALLEQALLLENAEAVRALLRQA